MTEEEKINVIRPLTVDAREDSPDERLTYYEETFYSQYEDYKNTFWTWWNKQQNITVDKNLNRAQKATAVVLNLAEGGLTAFSTVTSFPAHLSEAVMLPLLRTVNFAKGIGCLPVCKQLDPVINLMDIHMIMVPPSAAPVPIPHPFMGFSLRPKDFLALAAMTVSVVASTAFEQTINQQVDNENLSEENAGLINDTAAFGTSIARIFIGQLGASVKVGIALPRTVAGTSIRCLEHVPIGGGFHPVAENTLTKNTGHAWLGSMFVVADGSPLVGAFAHLQNVCSDVGMTSIHDAGPAPDPESGVKAKLYVPTGMIIPIPLTRMVLTNPIPSPINPLVAPKMLLRAGFNKLKAKRAKQVEQRTESGKPCSYASRALNKANEKLFKHKRTQGLYNKIDKKLKTYVGHPIDVAGGDLFTESTDFTFSGVIPLSFERVWYSDSTYDGPLGHGWHHSYDIALFVDLTARRAQVRIGDGRLINFDRIPTSTFPTPRYHRSEKLWLCYHEEGYYYLKNQQDIYHRFTTSSYVHKQEAHLLSAISNREGFTIRLGYDAKGVLTTIQDSVERVYVFKNDEKGRIMQVWTEAPEPGRPKLCIAEYEYSQEGDLIVHYDEMRQPMRLNYENHLLVKEITRNGHPWFFVYDGKKTGAKCIETWGEGGIHHFRLTYDKGETRVIDGEGNKTIYKHQNQIVYETVDAKGATWKNYHNQYGELERSVDPLGNAHSFIRDDWGNAIQLIQPDGQFTQLKYLDADFPYLPTEVIDARGGRWSYKYNQAGRMRERSNPLGAKTKLTYNTTGQIIAISNGLGVSTQWLYDKRYNVAEIISTTGRRVQYQYDQWNRCTHCIKANGMQQRRLLDDLGRTVVMNDFDGNVIRLKYDALDHMIQYDDQHRSISFRYEGIHSLMSRKEDGRVIRYVYDSNERLRRIQNEEGQHYDFDLDAVGQVVRETGFDGVEKQYQRNAAGWITRVQRPNQQWTQYDYDQMGRVIQVEYHDAMKETYTYEGGLLRQAINSSGVVDLQYNLLGQVVNECFNGQQVQSTYDEQGRRTGITSSLGAQFAYQFDAWNNIVESQWNDWTVKRTYDSLGMECLRDYEGGMQQMWEYDALGQLQSQRVNKQQDVDSVLPQFYRNYVWEVGGLLRQITDQGQQHTYYQRDKRGFLQGVNYGGNQQEERGVDASGNLYQQWNCKDRTYKKNRLEETQTTRFYYDKEGYLVAKEEKVTGKKWTYQWNGAGMLSRVFRPEGDTVDFTYDALGRRVSKRYKSATTHYVWQGDVVLNEYKTFDARETTTEDIITWVFEEDSFIPMAKLKGNKRYSLVTDHLGTPIRAYTDQGDKVWERELDSFGNARMTVGDAGFCNYLYQGQTYDRETGLAYNRFRYYDPSVGNYISQDPIGLAGGNPTLYGYVPDPTIWLDVFGLDETYYRTMSIAHAEIFDRTGSIPATKETFISPSYAFSKNYEGITFEINVKDGTTKKLESIGVRDQSILTKILYPDMPEVKSGWSLKNAYFKQEKVGKKQKQVNLGLGKGDALSVFNEHITSSKRIGQSIKKNNYD